jgi:hypothetical protein
MDSKNCRKLGIFYHILADNHLILKKLDFRDRNERLQALSLKEKLGKVLAAIEKMVNAKIVVENMRNPFLELYYQNGLAEPARETVEIDLEKRMAADCAFYRSRGLETWADEILKSKNRLKIMGSETKRQVAREMQDGATVMFMPGRKVQYSNISAILETALVPELKDESSGLFAHGVVNEEFTIATNKSAKNKTDGIPERPYLLIVDSKNSSELICKPVAEQFEKIKKTNSERAKENRLPAYSIMPMEYAGFQSLFTDRVSSLKTKTGKKLFAKFKRIDGVSFLSMAGFFDRFGIIPAIVPWVRWDRINRLVYEVVNPLDVPGSNGGIRLVSRVELPNP